MAARRHKKYDLLDRITQSINDDGWNVIYLSDPDFHPFRLKIFRENETYSVKIYIWNLTHGGGAARPVDEYRIQITGVDQFEPEPDGRTLILGWWDEGGVFAGFDFNKHTGALGFSPSIQIREEALRKALDNGFAPWEKGNEEIAIAVRPDFFVEYIRNLEDLHSFGESESDLKILSETTETEDDINQEILETVTQKRRTTVVSIKRKIRDNSFKSRVLKSYYHKCAVCDVQMKLIDAAHIVPVEHNGTDEISNGISLCSLHHRAFDRALITINERYKILTSKSKMDKLKEIGLDGGMDKFISNLRDVIHLPRAVNDRPHVENIRIANEIRGWN